jgi:hypothetical protein
VFVHLLDAQGAIRSQVDSEPLQGARPTRGWVAGEYLLDSYRIPLDTTLAPGTYRIALGMYDPLTGERLAPVGQSGELLSEDRILLPDAIEVVAGGS